MSLSSEARYTLIEGRYTLSDVDYVKHLDTVSNDSLLGGFYIGIFVGFVIVILSAAVLAALAKLILFFTTGKA